MAYGRRDVAVYDGNRLVSIKGYEVVKKLGQGGFGTTYLAIKDGREYVVKEMKSKDASDEYAALTALGYNCVKHINCPVELINGAGNVSYLITLFIPGKDLDYYVRNPVSQKFINDMMKQLLSAISFIHLEGIAHRDIKPGNIMYVEQTNTFFLIDFGIACFPPKGGGGIRCPLACTGTPLFMHPAYEEQCNFNRTDASFFEILKRNDRFALGVTFFLIIEKTHPWQVRTGRDGYPVYNYDAPIPFRRATPEQQKIIHLLIVSDSDNINQVRQLAARLP